MINPDMFTMSSNNMNQQQSSVPPSEPSANSQVNLPAVGSQPVETVTSVSNAAQSGFATDATNPLSSHAPINLNFDPNLLNQQMNVNPNINPISIPNTIPNTNNNSSIAITNPNLLNPNVNSNVNAIPPSTMSTINNPSYLMSNLRSTIGAISYGPTQVRYSILLAHLCLHFLKI